LVEDKELIGRLIMEYALACQKAMGALNAVVEVGNHVVGARRIAADPGQAEASRQVFTGQAQREEVKFRPLYDAFEEARAQVKQAGADLIAACQDSDPDAALHGHLGAVNPQLLDTVATAVIFMRAPFRPPAAPFMDALQQGNVAMENEPYYGQPGFSGFIYSGAPTASAQSGTSVADELEKLAGLRDKGILTDTEFAAQKAKLLGS
jgi:putative oligomerization/nucleic acid binding protein